jgi:hypothetical protein
MRRHLFTALAVIPLLVFGLSACGSSGGKASTAGKITAAKANGRDQQLKFARCMRANGVNMPDPDPNGRLTMERKAGDGQDDAKVNAAQEKCRKLLPGGGQPPKLSAADLAKMREFAKCMREHGVAMEDPGPDGLIKVKETAGAGKGRLDSGAAEQACQKLMPELGGQKG